MQLNPAARELIFKVVYYGPGMSGKTSNFQWLHDHAPQGMAGDLESIDVHSERTLRFDLLMADVGQIQGHNIRIDFHTVPGQSYYAATRRQVLTGADGVVFVADSRREALDENIASMNEMLDNLRQLGMPAQIPVVLQYNKQDLGTAVPREQLDPLMNVRSWPSIAASAAAGRGVDECLRTLLGMLVDQAGQISLPELPTEIEPRTWLISCHRCQAMLEVPDASIGAIYTCGVCNSTLEVVDPDRGLTREPAPGRSPLPQQQQLQQQRGNTPLRQQQLAKDDSGYGMKTLPVQQEVVGSALQPSPLGGTSPPGGVQMAGGDFPVPGWDVVSFIDENPQGRRLKVRDGSGRTCRALVLSAALMRQPGYAEGLEPFVRLAGPLKHPHVLPLLEMRPAGETAVLFSSEVPEHEPLSLVLGRRRALAPPHAMGILRQVVLALEDAARQGVVHGWLRPECILVSPDGQVQVDEFALPKNHRFLVRELAGASAATEYYLAPEHLGEDARSDLRSDMFLCGALLYRMITGEGLVTGYNAHEALHKLLAAGGRPLRAVGNTVSRDLDLFYRKLTAVNRGERFESYRQLIEMLDRFGGGAKRQTLRLTQNISGPGTGRQVSPGTGTHLRTTPARGTPARATPAGTRVGTGQFGNPGRRTSGETRMPPAQRRSGGGAVAVIIVLVVLLGMAGVVWYVTQQAGYQPQPVPPTPPPVPPQQQAPQAPVAPTAVQPTRPDRPGAIGAVPPAPPQPAPPAPAAQPQPAPAAGGVARAELSPSERRDLLNRIADLTLAERWQQALVETDRLPAAEDRLAQSQNLMTRRDARRRELEQLARSAGDLAAIEKGLRPALEGGWGMPGDREWARGLMDQAEARLAGATVPAAPAPPVPAPAAPVAPAPAPAAPAPEPVKPAAAEPAKPAADAGAQVLQALAQGQFPAAQQAAAAASDASEGRALRLAVGAYQRRGALLDRVGKARTVKLRLIHPTTGESVDVSAAADAGIEVTSPAGSISALTWAQVGARDTGRLLAEAAGAPGATAEDAACAVTGQVVGGETTLAAVQLRRARAALGPETSGDLEALIAIGRRAESGVLLARAQELVRSGPAKALADCIAELKKPERAAIPAVAAAMPRLEAALADLQAGKGPASQKQLVDHVGFDGPEELQQFPDLAGAWQVAAGAAVNTSAEAKLVRRDTGSAKSVQIIFTPAAKRGAVAVEFKGLKIAFDLAGAQFSATVGAAPAAPKPCSVVERVPNTLFLDYKEDGNHTAIELNGQVLADVVMGDLGETFAFAVGGGAVVQVDDVAFTRGAAATPGQQALRQLGWDTAGNVALDDKAGIVLTGAATAPASISRQVENGVVGYTLDVKGQGAFRIQVGGAGGWQNADIQLVAGEATRLTVRWAQGTFAVLDGNGVPLISDKLARPVTNVLIMAMGPTTVALPIRPNRQ